MTQVTEPFPIFYDDDGTPLENGMIYIGQVNQDPRANPVVVYTDFARTIPIAQPIRTLNGRPAFQGAPINLYVAEAKYSIAIQNRFGTPIVSAPDGSDFITSRELAASDGSDLVGFIQSGAGAVARTVQDKAREIVSVKDFGAVGDGVTNDAAAIQAALNAALHVTFGSAADNYLVSDTITLRSGHVLDLQGATVTQATDQKIIFNADARDNVTIRNGRFVGKTEATFTNTPTSLAMAIRANAATDLSVTGCRFENFHYAALGVMTAGARIEFSHNFVKGPGAAVLGVDLNRRNCIGAVIIGDNIRIVGNDIYDTATGIILGQGSSNAVIGFNTLHDFINEHGLYVDTSVRNITIIGNTIRNTGAAGDGLKVQHYTSYGIAPYNVTIVGNTIENTGSGGISILNSNPTGSPIYGHNATITGNTIRDAGSIAINVRHYKAVAVSGNQIYQAGTEAIFIEASEDVSVTGNQVYGAQNNAVFVGATLNNRIKIASNQFTDVGKAGGIDNKTGILTFGGTYVDIRNNEIHGDGVNTVYGINLGAGNQTTFSVVGNYVDGVQFGIRYGSTTDALLCYLDNQFVGSLAASNNTQPLRIVASAATITIPAGQRVVRVTGTTNITTINVNGFTGQMVTLVFDNALTVTRGSNVYVASNFVTSAFDTLTLICDGVNWLECSRSAN